MRNLTSPIAALAIAGSIISTPTFAASPGRPVVRVETGKVAGTSDRGTLVFRGIPYAAPPVGPRRWRPPEPAAAWQGIRDASVAGAACPQPRDRTEFWAQVGRQSEDCLFLNVWRPAARGRYPVMVFIHGGAFTYGAGDLPTYDGARLAGRGAVVVTFNYRLGRLGFFAHPALSAEDPDGWLGNYGIMDQIAALRWVRRNIALFGGDSGNVTVFGESAGAGSVQLLMTSPVSARLLDKAIIQSGGGSAAISAIRTGKGDAESAGKSWAERLGLARASADTLRAVLVEKVATGYGFPFVDGRVVVASPGDAFRRGLAVRIPLLIGSNSNEGSLFGDATEGAKPVLGDNYSRLLALYAARSGAGAALDLAEDATFVLPALSLAAQHERHKARAYAYLFTQVRSGLRPARGAPHAGELEYLFGTVPAGQTWDESDYATSRIMGDLWVRFARTGNPSLPSRLDWPRLGQNPITYLVLGPAPRIATLTTAEEEVRTLAWSHALAGWDTSEADQR